MSGLEKVYEDALHDPKVFKTALKMTKQAFHYVEKCLLVDGLFRKPFPSELFFFLHFASLREAKYDQFLAMIGLPKATAFSTINRVSHDRLTNFFVLLL